MYSQQALRELRDTMIQERNANQYVSTPNGRTARYICDTLMLNNDPEAVKNALKELANEQTREDQNILPCRLEDYETDFALAYDILFGDIDVAPLHINDALASVAAWRLKQAD
jgi:hypothetical protein